MTTKRHMIPRLGLSGFGVKKNSATNDRSDSNGAVWREINPVSLIDRVGFEADVMSLVR